MIDVVIMYILLSVDCNCYIDVRVVCLDIKIDFVWVFLVLRSLYYK